MDGYGTHTPILKQLLKDYDIKVIVEDGGGDYSTKIFLESDAVRVFTCEENQEWAQKLVDNFADPHGERGDRKWILCESWDEKLWDSNPDLVLIDGPRESRAARAQNAFDLKVPFVVIHDTELVDYYNLTKINPVGYRGRTYVAEEHPKKKQTTVYFFEGIQIKTPKEDTPPPPEKDYELHFKMYGLPRTYTNWVAHNIMTTWPQVKVWHNNGPKSPQAEAFWKHGDIKPVLDVDAYLFIKKEYKAWKRSMMRYLQAGMLKVDKRFLKFIYAGWQREAAAFCLEQDKHSFTFYPYQDEPEYVEEAMQELYDDLKRTFSLPEPTSYHFEEKRMWRAGDASTPEQRVTNEIYRPH